MNMAERIKERRLAMGYTQEELAQKLGLQKSAIAKYENGRVENIKRSIIAQMSEILDCTPAYLMGWDDDPVMKIAKGKEGLTAILSDIYGYANEMPVCGKYAECIYYKIGKNDDAFAINELDFDQLYDSVKTTVKQFVSFIKHDVTDEYQLCLELANTLFIEPCKNDKSYLEPQAAHERTDIEVTDEMRKHDDDIMDDDEFWK